MNLLLKSPKKIFILVLLFLLISIIHTPKYPEPIFHPLTTHYLTTISGKKVQLENILPDQDYLLIFFTETSKTSLKQLLELKTITAELPTNLAIICVHIGRLNRQPDLNSRWHLFLDPQTELSQRLQIYTVPTVLLVKKNRQRGLFSQKFISATELLNHISRWKKGN